MTDESEQGKLEEITEIQHNQIVWEAVLAYIPFVCLYPWFIRNSKPEIKPHAIQGMILFIVELFLILLRIPFFSTILWIGIAFLALAGAWAALNGDTFRVPVLADLVDTFKTKSKS